MAEVSFICKRTVISTKPVQPGKFCPLSVLDRVMERNYLHIVLYYQSPVERNPGELTKKLREANAEMLSSFPIITGRLLKTPEGHWTIKCNDAGMRMVEARAKGSVEEWLQNLDREKELQLVHWEEMFHKPYFWSTFYVKVTEFEEGGIAIGLSCTHLLSDPPCATMLMKAWADMTLGGKMISPPLFHPLPGRRPGNTKASHDPYVELIDHYKSYADMPAPVLDTKQATVTLRFEDEFVRSWITRFSSEESSRTPFEALAALFWVVVSKVKGTKGGLTNMSICLDMRKVLGLDRGFFGNCMVYNKVNGDGIEGHELCEAANAIKEVVKKMDADGIMDLIEWLEARNCQNPPWMNGYDLICVNLEDVDSYSALFEDNARPLRVSYYIEPPVGEGQILILPPPAGGRDTFSRVVMITLPENEVKKLLEDALIQELSPTILMGLKKTPS
ncbi:ECERIFERUM 26-like [Olea europaea subsp. europaea]|uniref:ECERIFERUM 26-like n=1 Tax=Olea europaea subsp. europaea TaxID=158383 RepID=A0A8S0PWI6_OLEEU|nr:ECERIFERUM 26-like [Olea europaea subsp. europaea]